MAFTICEISANHLVSFFIYDHLCFYRVSLFLAGVILFLFFLGLSIGDSVASTKTISYSISLFNKALRPGKLKSLCLTRSSSFSAVNLETWAKQAA